MVQINRDFFWIVLLPLSWIYSFGVSLVLRSRKTLNPGFPVLSVGNIHLGGTGKTPLVIQLANHFQGKKTAILSRGYKSTLSRTGVQLDRRSTQGPPSFGDEPWIIAQSTESDVFIGANRCELLKKFDMASRYQIGILDDGYQHVQLGRKVNVVALPVDENPWEMACFPMGTLREKLSSLKRATLIIMTTSDLACPWIQDWKDLISQLFPKIPCYTAVRKLVGIQDPLNNHSIEASQLYGAFCGIARPQRFFQDLNQSVSLQFFQTYPDHHEYSRVDVEKLIDIAKKQNLKSLITTKKDYSKVVSWFQEFGFPLLMADIKYELPPSFWSSLDCEIAQTC